jgi:hypothetical protein
MTSVDQQFVYVGVPKDNQDALQLSKNVTMSYGSKGWQIVAVVPVGPNLLVVFQRSA